ncbi:MAG: hypothetical protein M1817_006716 [Caeruleum heppii]|nr:MAG: hypothetical protein M1817_006716 [Caeruleum heppii]
MGDPNNTYPHLGATFTPGGVDDFYMPEVISPAPQRVMPEVPGNIQQNLATLELEANTPRRFSQSSTLTPYRTDSISTVSSYNTNRHSEFDPHQRAPNGTYPNGATNGYRGVGNENPVPAAYQTVGGAQPNSTNYTPLDQPSFSPFPRLRNPPPNVPSSDDEKEAILEQARAPVLNSNDPEMQLAWAQDALAYVEVAMQNEIRLSEFQPARPQTPQVEHQLRVDAINVVSFLADQHHPRAAFMKGMWLEFGKFGFRVDKKEAFRCYSRAAERGYARAEYRIGMQYESSSEPMKAIQHYNRGVSLGDSASNYRLGMMILLGQHGQKQDYGRGVQLIRFAAQHADENAPQGAYVFGMLQARELPKINIPEIYLPLDLSAARVNIEKAAYLGFAKAQQKMGSAYELCQLGCDFNPALSLHYNALAARQGEPEADMAISKWFLCGYDGLFEKNEELAYVYAQRAAQGGLATAEFAMGYFHEIGMYVPADLKLAQQWYEKAATHGNKDAAGRIDGLSRSVTLSKKDHEQVAIARIKSQYGSQKAKRPERFKASAAPTMPVIKDDRIDMPDPSSPTVAPGPGSGFMNANTIGQNVRRPPSAAPYPVDDMEMPMNGGFRPSTAACRNNPPARPASAFNINPNIRPVSVATTHSMPVAPPSNYRGTSGFQVARPVSSFGNLGAAAGRGGPSPRGGRIVSAGAGPMPNRDAGAPGPGSASHNGQLPKKPSAPQLDIGFSAPPDPGADKRHRLQKTSGPMPGKVHPPEGRVGGDSGAVGGTPTLLSPTSGPPAPSFREPIRPVSSHGHGPNVPAEQMPARVQAMKPESRRPHSRPSSRPGSPPHGAKNETSMSGALPPQPSAKPMNPTGGPSAMSASAVPPRPPGKGPKTFEEMGVPVANKDNDCVIM